MLLTIYCIINYLNGQKYKHNNEVDKQRVNQSHIFVPPIHYNLYVWSYQQLKCNIEYLILNNHFVGSIHKQNAIYFLNKVNTEYPYNNCIVGYVPSSSLIHKNIIRQIIGTNGYFLNKTRNVCNIDFIWHDRETNMFYFFGRERENVTKAMNSIRWRIQKCYTFLYNNKTI